MNPIQEPANEPNPNEGPEMEPPETPEAETKEHQGIDIEDILEKVQIAPDIKDLYEKCLVNGMRFMFDKGAFAETAKHLAKDEPMPKKIADGVVAVVYMLWEKSNKTLNPQVIVPVTFALTLKGFEFLQESGHPEATKEVLGAAVEMAVTTIMQKFNVPPDQIEALVQQNQAAINGAAPTEATTEAPQQTGILGGMNG